MSLQDSNRPGQSAFTGNGSVCGYVAKQAIGTGVDAMAGIMLTVVGQNLKCDPTKVIKWRLHLSGAYAGMY